MPREEFNEELKSLLTCSVSARRNMLHAVCWGKYTYVCRRIVVDDRVVVEPRGSTLLVSSDSGTWTQRELKVYMVHKLVLGDEYRERDTIKIYTKPP
jgi:hypothetical protein